MVRCVRREDWQIGGVGEKLLMSRRNTYLRDIGEVIVVPRALVSEVTRGVVCLSKL